MRDYRKSLKRFGSTTDGHFAQLRGHWAYQTVAAYGDGIKVVIPPRSTAVPSGDPGLPTQRDRHLAMIAEQGRLGTVNLAASDSKWLLRGMGFVLA